MDLRTRISLLWIQNNYGYISKKNSSRPSPLPPLLQQNFPINLQSSARFLGIIFDHNISSTPHIKLLKTKFINFINILKYLSHSHMSCNRKLFLQLYNSIRSRIDYDSPIFQNACKSSHKLLDSIQSSAIRLVFSAFRSIRWTIPPISLPNPYRKFPSFHNPIPPTSNF